MERTYENAIKIIESRQRQSRPNSTAPASVKMSKSPADSGTPDLRGTPSIVGMSEWLQILGHSNAAIDALNVIHVAGTKGKGSTCAFIESFLRAHGQRTGYPSKTGMYTSPHLILPEERIRINSLPLTPARFAEYFFEVYDRLPQLASNYDPHKSVVERGPRILQLYALLALHVFVREKVEVAIIETHSGGEYDATNVVREPVVTAITTLGMDHVQMLGPSIENIAWHKAGIFKPGAVALSTIQEAASADVLVERAGRVGADLRFVGEHPRLPKQAIQLKPSVQKMNASLAMEAANAFLQRKSQGSSDCLSDKDIELGIQQWQWPGRFQTIPDGERAWFLDAAHNDMSVRIAAEWFVESGAELDPSASQVLVFSHVNELRDAVALLKELAAALKDRGTQIGHAIFTTCREAASSSVREAARDREALHRTWERFYPDSRIWDESSVRSALHRAEKVAMQNDAARAHILITGSQHLVGPALRILQEG